MKKTIKLFIHRLSVKKLERALHLLFVLFGLLKLIVEFVILLHGL